MDYFPIKYFAHIQIDLSLSYYACAVCIWNVVYRYVLLHKLVCCALLQVIAQVGEVFSEAEETSGNAAHDCNSRSINWIMIT